MTPEQKVRLKELLPPMLDNARRTRNAEEQRRRFVMHASIKEAMEGKSLLRTPEECIAIAERDAAGWEVDRPIPMTMAQMLSGKPPESFL
jgi:hypothetical protein